MEIPLAINLPDQQVSDPYGQALENILVSPSGVMARPGSETILDLGTSAAVDGIYNWLEQNICIAVSDGDVFKLSDPSYLDASGLLLEDGSSLFLESGDGKLLLQSNPAVTDITGAEDMAVGTRVIFANYGDWLYMANGEKIQEIRYATSYVTNGGHDWECKLNHTAGSDDDEPGVGANSSTYWTDLGAGNSYDAWATGTRYGSGNADVLEDGDAPTTVKWIGIADQYLLALETSTQRMWFSVVTEPYDWDSDYVSAEYLPDNANCLRVQDGYVVVGGTRTIEYFTNDGTTPWVRSSYGALTRGILAPYTFLWCPKPGFFLFIDNDRRLVKLSGLNITDFNESLDTLLQTLTPIEDAISDYFVVRGIPHCALHFPTADKTIVINLNNGVWEEWFRTDTNNYRWDGYCIADVPGWNMTLIGADDGKIKIISTDYGDDDGTAFSAKVRTPRIVTSNIVSDTRLVLYFLKVASASTSASITVRWRDDNNTWKTARTITMSDGEQTNYLKKEYRLGAYRDFRQYEFDLTNIYPFALSKVEQL